MTNQKATINNLTVDQIINTGSRVPKEVLSFLDKWFDESDSIVANTSGSTGNPKKIELQKEYMIASASMTGDVFELKSGDHVFCPLSATYIAGKMMIVRALTLGFHLHYTEAKSDPTIALHENQQYAFAVFTPHQIETIFTNQNEEKLNQIDTILLGGSPISEKLLQKIQSVKSQIYLGYAMTETMSHIALRKLNGSDAKTSYDACPGVTFSINESDLLIIHAEFLGIKSMITNDVVRLISQNKFEWLGRADHIINSGGIKINPITVEAKLKDHISQPFYIVGISHDVFGDVPCLYIKGNSIDYEKIQSFLKSVLDPYEVPKEIRLVDEFQYTANGKLKRLALDK